MAKDDDDLDFGIPPEGEREAAEEPPKKGPGRPKKVKHPEQAEQPERRAGIRRTLKIMAAEKAAGEEGSETNFEQSFNELCSMDSDMSRSFSVWVDGSLIDEFTPEDLYMFAVDRGFSDRSPWYQVNQYLKERFHDGTAKVFRLQYMVSGQYRASFRIRVPLDRMKQRKFLLGLRGEGDLSSGNEGLPREERRQQPPPREEHAYVPPPQPAPVAVAAPVPIPTGIPGLSDAPPGWIRGADGKFYQLSKTSPQEADPLSALLQEIRALGQRIESIEAGRIAAPPPPPQPVIHQAPKTDLVGGLAELRQTVETVKGAAQALGIVPPGGVPGEGGFSVGVRKKTQDEIAQEAIERALQSSAFARPPEAVAAEIVKENKSIVEMNGLNWVADEAGRPVFTFGSLLAANGGQLIALLPQFLEFFKEWRQKSREAQDAEIEAAIKKKQILEEQAAAAQRMEISMARTVGMRDGTLRPEFQRGATYTPVEEEEEIPDAPRTSFSGARR